MQNKEVEESRGMVFDLIERFEASEISRLKFKSTDIYLELEKKAEAAGRSGAYTEKPENTEKTEISAAPASEETGIEVKAPLAGIFYASPKPDAPPYVKQGQTVKKGEVLGLVEAMKMMNEITSPADGIVEKIYAENEKFAEFKEPLFLIRCTGL